MISTKLKIAQSLSIEPEELLKHFCEMLTKFRKESQMSQADLAASLGTSRNTIVNWETGKRTPDIISVCQIAQIFNISLDLLLGVKGMSFSSEELTLIDRYRGLSEGNKKLVKQMLLTMQKTEVEEKDIYLRETYRVIDVPSTPVAAGGGCEFNEIGSSYMYVRTYQAGGCQADAALRVSGRSMEPLYHDGDMVYVSYCDAADDGEDVIARIGSEKAVVIKRLQDGKLYSLNRDMPFRDRTEDDDVRIIARVLGVVCKNDLPNDSDISTLDELFHEEILPYLALAE